jgi:hypothetical protein
MANNFRLNRILSLAGLAIVAAVSLVGGTSCEPGGRPIIENQRNQELKVKIFRTLSGPLTGLIYTGVVPAQTTKQLSGVAFPGRGIEWMVTIEVIDPSPSGGIIFSHGYNMSDLEKINWKITIPP